MQSFNIVKENEIEETYRVSKIKNDFDLQNEHCKLELRGGWIFLIIGILV